MSDFDIAWLDLREPADRAARDPSLLARAGAWLDASPQALAVDLGSGSGSTWRALAPCLSRPARWRLIDHDPDLLAEALRRADGAVDIAQADLAQFDPAMLGGARLVTCSALLDLVSAPWIEILATALPPSAALYAALSYDGTMGWRRPHPLDDAVAEAFNRHQQTDKGFGPALGPHAADVAAARLRDLGFTVHIADSAWRLGPGQAALERALVAGIARAAGEFLGDTADWRAFRQAWAGDSGCVIGHQDLLALPAA